MAALCQGHNAKQQVNHILVVYLSIHFHALLHSELCYMKILIFSSWVALFPNHVVNSHVLPLILALNFFYLFSHHHRTLGILGADVSIIFKKKSNRKGHFCPLCPLEGHAIEHVIAYYQLERYHRKTFPCILLTDRSPYP